MKHFQFILIFLSLISLSFAEDRPLPPLEDFVMQENGQSYILQRCVALYNHHAQMQVKLKEFQGDEYDNTDEVQYYRDALLLNIYQQVFFPNGKLSKEKQSEMIAAYKRTKSKFIWDDNAICGEVLRFANERLENIQESEKDGN